MTISDNGLHARLFDLALKVLDDLSFVAPEDLAMRQTKVFDKLLAAYEAGLEKRTADAAALWQLLDNIDTLDDSCRESDAMFRDAARKVQKMRFNIAGSDGYALRWNRS